MMDREQLISGTFFFPNDCFVLMAMGLTGVKEGVAELLLIHFPTEHKYRTHSESQ